MILKNATALEQRKLAAVARQLSTQGFQVVLRPQDGDLPAFLKGFRPAVAPHSNVIMPQSGRGTRQGHAAAAPDGGVAGRGGWGAPPRREAGPGSGAVPPWSSGDR